ncbi:MAG: protein kinase [Phycisphaerales bacterium]|nr:protein kinase [Phycisphaerales bacterium]
MNKDSSTNPTCPMSDTVRRFARNEASAEEQSLIEQHLDHCTACQNIIEADHSHNDIDSALQKISQRKESRPNDLTIPVRQLNEVLTDYEILEQIGKGGMGVVYKARQIHLGRLVALKVLPSFYGVVRPNLLEQFKTEAGIAARLKHSSIISIYDFGEVNGTLFYAMELIEGRTIADFIRSVKKPRASRNKRGIGQPSSLDSSTDMKGRHDPTHHGNGKHASQQPEIGRDYFRLVARWMAEVADALAYAHNCNVIHGDIKPANLLVAHDERITIADFGLAQHRAAIEEDVTKSTIGTLRYMSPEQIDRSRGKPDHRSDVYAIGATLYELLTLRPMVGSTADPEVLLDVLNREPLPPRRRMPQVPRELEIICLKACEKVPSNRYVSASEMAEDLNRWLLDLPIHAKRPSMPIRAAKYVRRHRGTLVGASIVAAALTLSFLVYQDAQESKRQAIIAAKDARGTARDMGLAIAIQNLFFNRPEQALQSVQAVDAAYPGNIDAALLEWAILLRVDAFDKADRRLDASWTMDSIPSWVRNVHASYAENRNVEQTQALQDMAVRELRYRSLLKKDPQNALSLIETALGKFPNDILCNVVSCFLYHAVGNYEEMQHSADRIMLLRPNWAIGFGLRGLAVLSMGNYEDANVSLTRAILLQPDCARWYDLRSRVNLRFKRYADAEHDAAKAISLDPNLDEAFVNRANARLSQNNYAGAIQDVTLLIEKQEQAWLYVFRSKIHKMADATNEQLVDLLAASSLDPFDAKTAALLGDSYLDRLDYANAIQEYDRSLDIAPDNIGLRFKRAFASELNKDYEIAAQEYRELDTPGAPLADKAVLFQRLLNESRDTSGHVVGFSVDRPPRTLWYSRVFSFLDGKISSDDLISDAGTRTEISEAHFYVARVMMNSGKNSDALSHLKACIRLEQVNTLEYILANILVSAFEEKVASRRTPDDHGAQR